MNIKVLYSIFVFAFIQPFYFHATWKQIDISPFSIRSNPISESRGPRQLTYSPNGSFLAVANAETDFLGSGSVSMFAVNKLTGTLAELPSSPFPTQDERTVGLAFSPQGPSTLTAVNNRGISVIFDFNATTGLLDNVRPITNGSACPINIEANSVTYTPQGNYVAMTGNDPTDLISIYQVNQTTGDLTCLQEVTPVLFTFPRSAAYYPLPLNPSYLVVANNSDPTNDIVIFNANPTTGIISNPKEFSLRNGQGITPHWVTFSPDGQFIAVAVEDGVEVRKFRVTGFNSPSLLPLTAATSFFPTPSSIVGFSGVRSVAYSPNGKWLATANANETISVFCVNQETGALFNRQDLTVDHIGNFGSDDFTFSVTFSPDSRFLAVSNRDDNSISVFTNTTAPRPTCQSIIALSHNDSCAACTSTVN